jgi:MFS transporter, DHA2 family, multidrug resistance protein
VLYRSALPEEVAGLGGGAVRESLARAAEALDPGGGLEAARESFTWAMQVTAGAAALLLAVATATAWRATPPTRSRPSHDGGGSA